MTHYYLLMAFILVIPKEIPLQTPRRHIWMCLNEELQTRVSVSAHMGALLWISYNDDMLHSMLSSEFYDTKPSPFRPIAKCNQP